MAYPETFDAIRLGCGADSTLAATRLGVERFSERILFSGRWRDKGGGAW